MNNHLLGGLSGNAPEVSYIVQFFPKIIFQLGIRIKAARLLQREVAQLHPHAVAATLGPGLTALVEISLDRQGQEHLDAFEALAVAEAAVQQCYRVSPGPDFVLVLAVRDMPAYQAVAQRLFTQHANVRHVRASFSVKRAKFAPALPLPL